MPMRFPSDPKDSVAYLKGYCDGKLDYETKQGKWEDPKDITCYKCSICGEYATQEYGLTKPIFWRYCPNCGSKMEVEK